MSWKEVGLPNALRQSMIKMYQRCPKQFEFAYIKGIKSPPNLKMIVGTAVHKGVEVNFEQKLKSKRDCAKDVVLDATRDEFKRAVKAEGLAKTGKTELGRSQDEAIIMAGIHHEQSAPHFQPALKPETYFEIAISGSKRVFQGTIDLIAYYAKRSGALVLSDTKTTRRAYDRKRADVDTQLTAYSYAAHRLLKKLVKYVLFDTVVLLRGGANSEHVVSTRSMGDLKRFEETFKAVERGIDAGVFPPTDNEQTCGWCGYRAICHKGRAWTV